MVTEITVSTARVQNSPLPQDDPRRRRPDISFAKEAPGWIPQTDLREGIENTIRYFDDLMLENSARV
ncbi:MAG: hypothetical protein HKM98_08025 [Gammaproteobacteria bacterium]|nr:hypothetical protein [Gammaproteobacteria bacterium]